MNNEKILDISWGTLSKVGVAFFAFYVIYLIRDILIWFIFALIISILLTPVIDFLQRKRIPRIVSSTFILIFIFSILGISIYLIAFFLSQNFDSLVDSINKMLVSFTQRLEEFAPFLKELGGEAFESPEAFTKSIEGWLDRASGSIISAIEAIFGGIFAAITIFTLAVFFSLEEKGIERAIRILFPKKKEEEALNIWKSCQLKISGWFGARILACFFVGIFSYIALRIFGINHSFILALFAGVTNIIPVAGPIIAGVVIALIAALDSLWMAAIILLAFIIIQQIESDILMPILAKKFIGLPPALVLISLLIGGKLWGILGAILIIPLAGIIFEFTRDYLKKRKEGDVPPANPPTASSSSPTVPPRKSIIW